MDKEKVLYPCYFDESLTRAAGRRVNKTCAVKSPSVKSIVLAAKKLGLSPKADKGSHPAFWSENEGRVLVAWDGPKEVLIQKVAQNLKAAEK
ncbi:MAG: signal recognition particle subunit SRP19/SEC65 family protein [Methanomicrobium sp.]|nr:signal recognition particle subunit SRP19/SEC65 family protein [Methanomicrobium sp.]MBO4522834.1 signal recognition particle subunit SRP19/SEC65 family protein [Methanomicrobium sp.]MBR6011945.1 signal recognition particle subunit SRP19/SEC65 family protein [Methanomicrobium sp.]